MACRILGGMGGAAAMEVAAFVREAVAPQVPTVTTWRWWKWWWVSPFLIWLPFVPVYLLTQQLSSSLILLASSSLPPSPPTLYTSTDHCDILIDLQCECAFAFQQWSPDLL